MNNVAQVDRIISEINDLGETDKILLFRKMDEMFADSDDLQDDVSIESAFGLWKGREITTKESLREKAWAKR